MQAQEISAPPPQACAWLHEIEISGPPVKLVGEPAPEQRVTSDLVGLGIGGENVGKPGVRHEISGHVRGQDEHARVAALDLVDAVHERLQQLVGAKVLGRVVDQEQTDAIPGG